MCFWVPGDSGSQLCIVEAEGHSKLPKVFLTQDKSLLQALSVASWVLTVLPGITPLSSRDSTNNYPFVVVVVRQLSPGERKLFTHSCVSDSEWKHLNLPSWENDILWLVPIV